MNYGRWGPKYSWLGLPGWAAAPACLCRLHAVAERPAALVSDEKRIRGVYATIRYTNWNLYLFYRFVFCWHFFFFSSRDPWVSLAIRRKILLHDRKCIQFYNASQKILGDFPPKKIRGQKHAKFGVVLDDFKLRWQMSPEQMKIFKIGQVFDLPWFLRLSEKGWANFGPLITGG